MAIPRHSDNLRQTTTPNMRSNYEDMATSVVFETILSKVNFERNLREITHIIIIIIIIIICHKFKLKVISIVRLCHL